MTGQCTDDYQIHRVSKLKKGGKKTPTAAGKTKQTNQRNHHQQKQNCLPFKRTLLVKCWKEKGKWDLPVKEAMDRSDIFNSILYATVLPT